MKKDILIFGDSIAYGIGDPLLGGWVDLLKRHTWENKPNLNIYNFCIDGNTTRDLLQRLAIQSSQTLYGKEAIFIAIGVNDSVFYKDGTIFMNEIEFEDNLKKLIIQTKAYTENVYIVGITDVDESKVSPFPGSRTGKTWSNERIAIFNKIIEKVAENNSVKYINMSNLINHQDFFDGLHVNTEGQIKMFNKIVDEIHFL